MTGLTMKLVKNSRGYTMRKKKETEDRRMNENSKMTDREIAELIVPDSSTIPLSDEEVKKVVGKGMEPAVDPKQDKWDRIIDILGDILMAETEIMNLLKRAESRDKYRMDMQYGGC